MKEKEAGAVSVIRPPRKVSEWVGSTVRAKFPVSSSLGTLPSGTIWKITSAGGVLKCLESEPCGCCGFKMRVTTKASSKKFLEKFEFVEVK